MIATNRRMPAHDFLLVAFSAAVIAMSTWPETSPRQWVQLREQSGTLRQYSLAESDPKLAKLRLALDKWARAGQETKLAVAQWRAELADLYAEKTLQTPVPSENPIRAVAFRRDAAEREAAKKAAELATSVELQQQHLYWVKRAQQAREEIVQVEEIRRSRKALEVPPPIVFGTLEPGRKPATATLFSAAIGLAVACFFALWCWLRPTLSLRGPKQGLLGSEPSNGLNATRELRLVVPTNWVSVRQPPLVIVRWAAMAVLAITALARAFSV